MEKGGNLEEGRESGREGGRDNQGRGRGSGWERHSHKKRENQGGGREKVVGGCNFFSYFSL